MTRHVKRTGHLPRHRLAFIAPTCVECGGQGRMESGEALFPNEPARHRRMFFACTCGAWVSCHKGTAVPAGRPASAHTRYLRAKAHEAFDTLWGVGTRARLATGHARRKAYRWLAGQLGIPERETHMGWFDAATCERVIAICAARQDRGVA